MNSAADLAACRARFNRVAASTRTGVACACALLCTSVSHAGPVTCSGSFTALSFGYVDPAASQTDATATLGYTCTNTAATAQHVAACFGIGLGFGDLNGNPRQMLQGASQFLQYQVYQDAARTLPWGLPSGTLGTPLYVQVLVPASGSASGSATVYGRVLAGQTGTVPGSYSQVLNANSIDVVDGNGSFPPDCSGGSTSGSGLGSMSASATVINPCTVDAGPLSFGTTGLLTTARTATSTITVQCANGTPYAIGLDAGLNGGGHVNARAMALGIDTIGYQLYADFGMSTVWGNTAGTDTVAGTGSGGVQGWTVYGRVPAQSTPTPGSYGDTVTVYVYY